MDPFQLLKHDHQKANDIFKKIADTSDGAKKTRERLCQQLKQELELHASVEEKHFYPALKAYPETRDKVPEAVNEHNEVRQKLAEIETLQPDDASFLPKIKELQKLVQHHVREEEREIFPAAKKVLDKDQAREIATRIEGMKKETKRAAAE